MTEAQATGADLWRDAVLAARLFAIDPHGLGGIRVCARPGPVRDAWTGLLRPLLPKGAPLRKVPVNVTPGRLLGGLDLAATLDAGRPVAEPGLLGECDGGVLMLAMAERAGPGTAAHIAQALDRGVAVAERDGLASTVPARFGAVLFDESLDGDGAGGDGGPPPVLLDRLAFMIDLDPVSTAAMGDPPAVRAVKRARTLYPEIEASSEISDALAQASLALGIPSLRPLMFALKAARAHAALDGRRNVTEADAAAAARLVLAPRATVLPSPPEEAPEDDDPPPEPDPPDQDPPDTEDTPPSEEELIQALADMVLAAAQAAIPPGLLAQLKAGRKTGSGSREGKSGALQSASGRGRPAGLSRGRADRSNRLNVIETLRAAAPWQPLRRNRSGDRADDDSGLGRIQVRKDDFRFTRYKQRAGTTTVFVVDASGSAALHRLAEVKGAVELMLAECYVRRDQVALIAFRGETADLILPPTRSLVRAKRTPAGLPGGGGTPLAAGLDAAEHLAQAIRRKGQTPVIVVMTDGRANVARDGTPDRAMAGADATLAAQRFRAAGLLSILVDASPRPQAAAERLAREMDAIYLPLPHAKADAVTQAVAGVRTSGGR